MTQRSEWAQYMLGGAFEADAKLGVADAIDSLEAAGITPVFSPATPAIVQHQEPVPGDSSVLTAESEREALRLKNFNDWIERMNQGSIRMSTDEAYRNEITKKLS